MADPWLLILFLLGAATSLSASWQLVIRIERIGAHLGLSEAILGMVAALAADGPEITAAVTALSGGHSRIGAGVVIGSNVFNLAALLGLGAVVSGAVMLHRRVILLEGAVALLIAGSCVAVIAGGLPVLVGITICVLVLVPYCAISSGARGRRWLPPRWREWLAAAVTEEEIELEGALDEGASGRMDALIAGATLAIVIAASIGMEQTASTLGTRLGVPDIIIGGLVLAAVTSLPNAVSAVYLARRGRGAATLSTAMNSNALNVLAGLFIPAAVVGLGARSGQTTLITLWYAGMTIMVLGLALAGHGLRRRTGMAIIATYVGFVVTVILTA